ncbi:MAG: MOSC domain-containing protein [Thermoanaerobaculia bacterium]
MSLLIGRPANHAPAGEPKWITAIFREPVSTSVFLTKSGFDGDEVADKRFHGGPDKAVLCYAISHYPKWREELRLPMGPGGFGENLSIEGQDETSVCIGDVYRMGEAEVQVSQPRGPCGTLARRWERLDLIKLVRQNHRSGWYIRVLREGKVTPGDEVDLISRPQPDWPVARTAEVYYSRKRDLSESRELADLPQLSSTWKRDLRQKLAAMAAAE